MHVSKSIFLIIITLLFGAEAVSASEIERRMQENRLLKSEYQLAKTRNIYILFDLVKKKVQIKAKGLLLREFPVEKFKFAGTPIQPKPIILQNKAALLKPKRVRIKPKKKVEGTLSDIPAFEVKDMPVRYRFDFDDGIHVYVRPKPEGGISALLVLLSSLKSCGITMPVGVLWNALQQKTYAELSLYLSPEDARLLYWGMPEGSRGIIYAFTAMDR
jgi:hypothetical protein